GASNKVIAKSLLSISGNGTPYITVSPAKFDGNGQPNGFGPVVYVFATSKIFELSQVGQWHQIEVHAKLNDAGEANGEFQVWINNNLEINKTDIDWVGSYTDYGFNEVELNNSLNAT